MIIAIASGKGGTGKTTVAVNMALSLENVQLLDCDVEEPNSYILLQPTINEINQVCTQTPMISEELCDYCGKCSKFCAYNALFVASKTIMVFPELCHSCGGCKIVCPKNAITDKERPIGIIKKGKAKDVEIVYGELNVGEAMAIPLIKAVKNQIKSDKTVIIDAPPGTACSLVVSVHKTDYCILVTEPTPFGLHDLKISVQVLKDLNVPMGVVINRAGFGDRKVYQYCEKENIPLLMEIPFDKKIAKLYSRGVPFVTEMPEWKKNFQNIWEKIQR
ncbi:(4Fe-4S)-binding protein [miscellaneous Crenarchaeota group-1 archaeon SG8-32-1]|uniref:(4Fe-4S)-binding protein n=1 Tax=miscellaneous Crenarchaeota group-1 archaeon SG8-32-1 TaxID=1685124 RepID=A0A0M0BMR2_9ARCH|nr:MAG: (4Fe-4S)-binding protein [miscellaneous Crenarchaeota group-1 archaeon SG8-32-1]